MSQWNQTEPVYATQSSLISSPGVTIKTFSLPPFGIEGWNYSKFDITLELFSSEHQRLDFAAEYAAMSYGRRSDGWIYTLSLYNDTTILGEIVLGQKSINCHIPTSDVLTGHIPYDPTIAASPYELFGLINRVGLNTKGYQETC